jgi:hypothetical protein
MATFSVLQNSVLIWLLCHFVNVISLILHQINHFKQRSLKSKEIIKAQ